MTDNTYEIDLAAGNQIHSRLNDSNLYNRSEKNSGHGSPLPIANSAPKNRGAALINDKDRLFVNSEGSDGAEGPHAPKGLPGDSPQPM